MSRAGPSWKKILKILSQEGVVHLTLIDPDPAKQSSTEAAQIAKLAEAAGTSGIMVGGSTAFGMLDDSLNQIKAEVDIPVILFPGNVTGLSRFADAIFFMSLLNSRTTYWMIDAQTLGARYIKAFDLEPISMGYLIVQPGGTAGFVGDARLIPRDKPEIALGYALAAQYMGFQLVYLEAGSGADNAVPLPMIKLVASKLEIPLAVGGGINTPSQAAAVAEAGADIIVQGTIIERNILRDKGKTLKETIAAIRKAKKH
ncbi:MAG: geranylgeranylglyceryl/heptaprenylglyceryl phosphate synthase [Candidatus Hermodarchaeota archaeon]|nr:geranylgeranylglyceryl/heptaprenylglyceryl phosphate synthase [Candidatus Hermodarchaeota archaeon]